MLEKPKVVIDNEVFRKIMHWVNKSDFEVSGLGTVTVDPDKGILRVTDAMLLPQVNGSTHTDIEPEDVGKLMYLMKDSPGDLRFWWHSHVQMPVFWSGTDMDTIKKVGQGGWFLSTVFNQKREVRSAFYSIDGCHTPWGAKPLFLDELTTEVEAFIDAKASEWDQQYEENVTIRQFAYKGNYIPPYGHWDEDRGWVRPGTPGSDVGRKRPAGMSKREWKKVRKEQKQKLTSLPAIVTGDDVDEYGFTQEERHGFALLGWCENDFDEIIAKGGTARDLLLLASNEAEPDEVIECLEEGWTIGDLVKHYCDMSVEDETVADDATETEEIVEELASQALDDIPVMDRARGGRYDVQ